MLAKDGSMRVRRSHARSPEMLRGRGRPYGTRGVWNGAHGSTARSSSIALLSVDDSRLAQTQVCFPGALAASRCDIVLIGDHALQEVLRFLLVYPVPRIHGALAPVRRA